MSHDAIVIGAGPSGATAAIGLARQGRTVALVERAAFPRRKVCGEYLSATAMPVLEALGVADAFRERAGPQVRRVGWFAGGKVALARMPESADGYGRALGRDVLDSLLLEAARRHGVDILQPARATNVASGPHGHTVDVAMERGTRTLSAPVLVSAHGAWEPGPLPSHLPKAHAPGDFLGFKAYFRGGDLPADVMTLLTFPGGYGGLVWADDGRLSLSCCINRATLSAARATHGGTAAEAVAHHLAGSMRGLRDVLAPASPNGSWLAAGPICPGIRPAYEGDIFRAGNLAGEAHPIVAEGIAMAIQSGWLAGTLAGGHRTSRASPPGRKPGPATAAHGETSSAFASVLRQRSRGFSCTRWLPFRWRRWPPASRSSCPPAHGSAARRGRCATARPPLAGRTHPPPDPEPGSPPDGTGVRTCARQACTPSLQPSTTKAARRTMGEDIPAKRMSREPRCRRSSLSGRRR